MKKILAVVLALCMSLSMVAVASANVEVAEHPVGGELIYGSTTEISGDWAHGAIWTNNASDNYIRKMIDDYATVQFDQGGALVQNKSTCESIESVVNEDGSKTFTVKIAQDLKYNNGDPINVDDYIASVMLFSHPTLLAMASKATAHGQYVGGSAYADGSSEKWSGVRRLDDYTYALTVSAEYIPYFFDLSYVGLDPLSIKYWLGEGYAIKDDGDGCYWVGDMSQAAIEEKITFARFDSDTRVSAGPYSLKSFDKSSLQAVLEINPNYKGNFEGQKPSVQKIIFTKAEDATMIDAFKTGSIQFLDSLADGDKVNAVLDLEKAGGYASTNWERNGFGKVEFQCDFGPTQFKAVRHAVARLFDGNEFANTFCKGYGSLVYGPYGLCMWMVKDAEEELAEKLDTYEYDPQAAVDELIADGWTLAADGTDYVEGIRYKKVTAEEAGTYPHNVTLEDGTVLMPLIIEWSSSEGNSVSELLATMVANSADVAAAGMQINQNIMTFDELLNWLYRDATQGDQYGVPTYGMFNLATGFTQMYDMSYEYTQKAEYLAQGWNDERIFDDQLEKLAWDMVYGTEAGDNEAFLKTWVEFIDLWNDLLPSIPLYSNIYYSAYVDTLKNYEQSPYWEFCQAIVYAYME